jgi:hypothetical protein
MKHIKQKKLAFVFLLIVVSGLLFSGCGKKMNNGETHNVSFQEQAAAVYEAKTPYAGNASAVGKVTELLPFANNGERNGMELQTEAEPYGVTLEYKDLSRIPEMELKGNAYLMFCVIENLGQVTFNDQTGKTSVQFLRGDVFEYGNTAEFFAENKEQFISFANRLNDEILKTE